jgi:Flp pilus assembly protein TadG
MEFALTAPLMVTMLLGLWELGRVIQVYQDVSNAAREGAWQASSAKYTNTQVQQVVLTYLIYANVPMSATTPNSSVTLSNTNAIITVTDLDTGGDVSAASQLDRIQVSVQVPTTNFQWLVGNFMPAGSIVSATASTLCTKDVPLNVVDAIPAAPLQ